MSAAHAQGTDTNYDNIGRNNVQDHLLGEITVDVGGQIPFSKTDGGASGLLDRIFDYGLLDQYLAALSPQRSISPVVEAWTDTQTTANEGATCAWFIQSDGVHSCPNACPPVEIGTMDGWYKWQSWRINGAGFFIYWNPYPISQPTQRHIFFGGPGGSSNAWKDWKKIDQNNVKQCLEPQTTDWDGMPRTLYQEVLNRGHIFIGITPTYGHSIWSMLLRINDILWWLTHGPSTTPPIDGLVIDAAQNGHAFCMGGSWAAFLANMAVLYDPQSIYGAYGGMMLPDFGYEGPQGGWRKLNAHRDAGIGMTVWTTPMRGQNYPNWFAVEQMAMPPDFFSEDLSGPEMAGYSLLQRRGALLREILGVASNVDRHFNHHWSMDTLKDPYSSPRTDTWPYYQLMGHAEPGGKRGQNEYWWENGPALLDALLADVNTQTNPPIPTTPPVPGQQYRNPYLHTLSTTLSALPVEPTPDGDIPFATEGTFSEPNNFGTVQRIGQGVFPGDQDSLKVDDWDHDGKAELVFGNFDGFVHRMEVETVNGIPLLKDLARSPPLGWGISALDVTTQNPSKVICADSAGHVWQMLISGTGISQVSQVPTGPETMGGSLKNLVIGDFASASGKEFFVQEEFQRYLLYAENGQLLGRTERTQASILATSTVSNYTGMTGKPVAINQPQPTNAKELLVPCFDGHLKRLWYDEGSASLKVHTYPMTHLSQPVHITGTLTTCLPQGNQSGDFLVVVGGVGVDPLPPLNNPTPDDVVPFLALVRIQGDNAVLLDTYADSTMPTPFVKDPVVALKWVTDGSSFLVGSSNQVAKLTISNDTIIVPAGGPPVAQLPMPPGPASDTSSPLATGRASICAMEVRGNRVFVPLPSGRIFILDKNSLAATRDSKDVEPWLFNPNDQEQIWPNNLTLGWTLGAQQVPGESPIYFLDSKTPFVDMELTKPSYYRIGALTPGIPAVIDEIVSADSIILTTLSSEGWNDLAVYKGAGSTYSYQASVEVGDLWVHNVLPLPTHHLFQNFKPWDMTWYDIPSGGYAISRTPADGAATDPNTVLDFPRNFDVTILPQYAAIPAGPNRLHGQVTTEHHPNAGLYFGNSMKVGDLWVSADNANKSCVVMGTLGGFVYAIDPTAPFDAYGSQSGLVYETRFDLGWGVMGLDIGEMNAQVGGDAQNEIVVGTWLDDARSTDLESDATKNRGHVIILDPNPATGALDKVTDITLDGDPLRGPFGAGILGVKIDDVNGDGINDIWCGDARGYLYLLKRDPSDLSQWTCYYRSAALGSYPGLYGNCFPVKNEDGKTTRLIVFTSGYVYNFTISPGV